MCWEETPLDELQAAIWEALGNAVQDRHHPWRTPALVTSSARGPEARTVVLRTAQASASLLAFHTDRRSAKVAELLHAPSVTWLFYDRASKVQLRVRACAQLHVTDPIADEAWEKITELGRRCYAAPDAPGSPVSAPPEAPAPDGPEDGRQHFVRVTTQVEEMDWLHLSVHGHRRAILTPDDPPRWVAP